MRSWIFVSGAGLALSASGCFFTSPSEGERGVVELAYDEGIVGCIFGCDASEPMAAEANTYLLVVNDEDIASEYGPFVVESTDTGVLELIQSDGAGDASIRVISHAPGSAHAVFDVESSGELIDRYEIEVVEIDRIELGGPEIESRLLIMNGGAVSLAIHLFDGDDRRLKGYGGVEYALTGGLTEADVTLTSALAEAIVRAFVGSTSESATIVANGLGSGQIDVTARVGGASLSIPAEVVDATRVATVEVSSTSVEPGGTASLSARAFDASGEEIFDPECVWTTEGTGVTVSFADRDSISLQAATETSGAATCTIGSVSAAGTATFEAMPES